MVTGLGARSGDHTWARPWRDDGVRGADFDLAGIGVQRFEEADLDLDRAVARAGCAVHTRLPAGAGYGTIEIKVSFLKPLTASSGPIEAHGRALRVGGRVAFAEAHARDQNGELVGHATTSLALSRPST